MDVRQRILEAAVERLRVSGFDGMTISSVATRSGLSRPTVYAHFGTREQLVSDALILVASRMLADIVDKVGEPSSAADYLVETMVAARSAFRAQPALAPLVQPHLGTIIFDGSLLGPGALAITRSFLAPLVRFVPQLEPDMDEIAETCIRFLVSVVQFESAITRTDDHLRAYLHRRLVPAVGLTSDQDSRRAGGSAAPARR